MYGVFWAEPAQNTLISYPYPNWRYPHFGHHVQGQQAKQPDDIVPVGFHAKLLLEEGRGVGFGVGSYTYRYVFSHFL